MREGERERAYHGENAPRACKDNRGVIGRIPVESLS